MNPKAVVPVIFLTLLVAPFALSQGITQSRRAEIRGQVRYADGRPASLGIIVYLDRREGGTEQQVQTDRQGKFEFMQVDPRAYLIRVNAPGYLTETQQVDVSTVVMAYVDVTLRPDPSHSPNGATGSPPGGSLSALDAAAPDNARKNLETGRDMLTQGKDIEKGIGYLQKAVAQYPKYPQAYLLLGVAYSAQGKWPEAEQALQKSVALNKDNAAAYVALGAAENQQKKYPEAEKALRQAVLLAPESADAQFELGTSYWGMQRWAEADQHVSKANQLRPDHAGQHILMGNILLRERNAPGALEQYKKAVELDPKGPFADSARQMISKIEAALAAAKK